MYPRNFIQHRNISNIGMATVQHTFPQGVQVLTYLLFFCRLSNATLTAICADNRARRV
jgi:hypothetical protein